ncbi:MAG: hypothetical protein ACLQGV_05250 [Bryobacteraceae bacterium]
MAKTTYEGRELIHRLLWRIVEAEAKLANRREKGWRDPTLVAMVFAFHAVEAYLNYVGEQLAPEVWRREREFFGKEPYRGWDGKLRKVMELVDLPPPDRGARPLKTILDLRELRDWIAHGRSERLFGEDVHGPEEPAWFPSSTLDEMITPRERLKTVLQDVELFLDRIHDLAGAKIQGLATAKEADVVWFGEKALRGTIGYAYSSTSPI